MKKNINERIKNNGRNFSHSKLFLNKLENPLNNSNQLEAIFEHLPDATFAINLAGEVIAWNQAMEQMTAVPADEILGKGNYQYAISFYGTRRPLLIDLISEDEDEIEKHNYCRIHKKGQVLKAETIVKKNGKNTYLWGKASALLNEKGEIIGAIESIRDQTERKLMEKKLKENKFLLDTLLDSPHDSIFLLDSSYNLIMVNKATAQRFGLEKEEMTGINIEDVLEPELFKSRKAYFEVVFKTNEPVEFEDQRDGIYYDHWIYPIKTDGLTDKAAVFSQDINIRKQDEQRVKDSEEKYRAIFEQSGTPLMFIEEDSTISMVNREFEKLSGFKKDEIEDKKSFIEFVASPQEKKIMLDYHHLRRTGKENVPDSYEFSLLTKDGQIKNILVKVSMVHGSSKSLAALIDITERKNAEIDLISAKEQFKSIFDHAPFGIYQSSPEGKIYEINKALADMLSYKSVEEFFQTINRSSLQEVVYVDSEERSRWVQEVLKDDKWHNFEILLHTKNNKVINVNLTSRSVRNSSGKVKYLEGFREDITES
jgi:PAS domain S-box-containing protein